MPLSEAETGALTDAIRKTAADEIMPHFRNLDTGKIEAKTRFDDLVTIADRNAEEQLTARFRTILPGAEIVGEEAISAGTASLASIGAERCVIIDPIDGTWNFAHGLASFGVIVAVVEAGQTVWGCLYDPCLDDWVEAGLGTGCWFHRGGRRERLQTVSKAGPVAQMRGNLGEYHLAPAHRPAVGALAAQLNRHVSLGASLWEYRMLCQGGSAFCLNGFMSPWDHAAGALCLAEAGGVSRLLDGRLYVPGFTSADLADGAYLLNARSEAVWEKVAELVRAAMDQTAPVAAS